ncbi:Linear gramicidin dehydrogenase LgrE [Nonomuraea coxensis DSM 45129]|uniref:Linear gramicidin dehydrogenase LgrE n=1 Tax=Nonomuraea coxensis DSM 45129 TaxID=1122611 RepID=A0ABX8U4K9_9ACTN|nr:alpha/beta fold hydrolase [Nonomuraea coxensis]QYC41593.1 Linear gramicidin dehydrogenase LgrE [Nonomuraea coxensis DSM 45129]
MTATRPEASPALWTSVPEPRPDAEIRLFCLPYAGGGSVEYAQWAALLPPSVEVVPVHLPGRERRIRERPHTGMDRLVPELADALEPALARPYALFGYSMGAWVAFELARELRRRGARPPRALLAAAAAPPDGPRGESRHDLPDPALVAWMRRLGGSHGMPLEDERLLAVVLPRVRADLAVTDTHVHRPEPPLACPVHVYTGADDEVVPPGEARLWARQAGGVFTCRVLPGGHFFLHERRRELLACIVNDLEV